MGTEVLNLVDIERGDVALAGGKGANLGELARNGFPIPPGFVVPAQSCQRFFEHLNLQKTIASLSDLTPGETESRCNEIRALINQNAIPPDLAQTVMSVHAELIRNRGRDIVCAVRSSATAEDLGEASFAGQHATYYYVIKEHLLEMIKHCWGSLWSPEAVSYRATQGIAHDAVFMAVVVQEMVQSDVSGVTFTANPVSGERDEIVIESSWGMGAAIVDGRVTPDHYILSRTNLKIREKRIADKRFMVPPFLEEGRKTRLQAVPHARRHKETLTKEMAQTAATWALKAEDHFGSPQDVEWSVCDGAFFMLQSRPITVMGRETIGHGIKGAYVLFKPIIENFTEPLTPLAADLYGKAMPPGIQLIQGWIYLNFKVFRTLFPYKLTDEEIAELLYGLDTKSGDLKLSPAKLPGLFIFLFFGFLIFGVGYARTRYLPDDFMDGFRDLCKKTLQDPKLGPLETFFRLLQWSKFFDPIGHQVMLVNWSAGRYFFLMDALKNLLRRWLPELREDAADILISGAEGVLSVQMGRGIWNLAQTAKANTAVRQILENHKPENALIVLKTTAQADDFLKQLEQFLAVHGHRGLKELEFRSARWEEDPTPVLGMVRNYLPVETDPGRHDEQMQNVRRDLGAQIAAQCAPLPLEGVFSFRRRILKHLVKRIKYFAKMRENSRFYHIMGFYMVRQKILKIETELLQVGKLKCKDDIFFLLWDEIVGLQTGRIDWNQVEDRIHRRRMEHIRLSKMFPPKTIGVKKESRNSAEAPSRGDILSGQAASPGTYEGVAHVILDPAVDIELRPGEVLVAPYTDPAWTPLFLTAGAAVVEVGSYLSHAGTVAREFGMPCVVDVSDCTKRIHSGTRVKVDGERGLVQIITEDEGAQA